MKSCVTKTATDAIVSKWSAYQKNYIDYPEVEYFVRDDERIIRQPLINRGYFSRDRAVHCAISGFLNVVGDQRECQIVNIGCGLDPLFFWTKRNHPKHKIHYYEIDHYPVLCQKAKIILSYEALKRQIYHAANRHLLPPTQHRTQHDRTQHDRKENEAACSPNKAKTLPSGWPTPVTQPPPPANKDSCSEDVSSHKSHPYSHKSDVSLDAFSDKKSVCSDKEDMYSDVRSDSRSHESNVCEMPVQKEFLSSGLGSLIDTADYCMVDMDLDATEEILSKLCAHRLNLALPTCWVAECVLAYLEPAVSDRIIQLIALSMGGGRASPGNEGQPEKGAKVEGGEGVAEKGESSEGETASIRAGTSSCDTVEERASGGEQSEAKIAGRKDDGEEPEGGEAKGGEEGGGPAPPPGGEFMIVCYDMFNVEDRFGRVMQENLRRRQCEVKSTARFTIVSAIEEYYRGFLSGSHPTHVRVVDMHSYYSHYLSSVERFRVEQLELFDEVEEWRLIQQHYFLACLTNNPAFVRFLRRSPTVQRPRFRTEELCSGDGTQPTHTAVLTRAAEALLSHDSDEQNSASRELLHTHGFDRWLQNSSLTPNKCFSAPSLAIHLPPDRKSRITRRLTGQDPIPEESTVGDLLSKL